MPGPGGGTTGAPDAGAQPAMPVGGGGAGGAPSVVGTDAAVTGGAGDVSGAPVDAPPAGPPGEPPAGSPVARWGALAVCGTRLCDKAGKPVQLKGISSMWLNWENTGYAQSRASLAWMRDNWNVSVIRAAMGVEPPNAYLSNPAGMRRVLEAVVASAVAEGLYVIVDWHDHNAHNHQAQAQAFFSDMAGKYGALPNVIWEPFNEPLNVGWSSTVKPYHQAIVGAIRARDPDNVIVLGTPQWSQRVDQAAADPVPGKNLMYTLHFYACSHTQQLRSTAMAALSRGLPLFVTEWGATHADGGLNGVVCQDEAQRWHDFLDAQGVSWTAWKLDDCEPDASCLLRPGAPVQGGWDTWLRGHGPFVRDRLKR